MSYYFIGIKTLFTYYDHKSKTFVSFDPVCRKLNSWHRLNKHNLVRFISKKKRWGLHKYEVCKYINIINI